MEEVALFVDFENIRYGVRNIYHRELRVDLLMEKARSYGLVRVAKAYGDFVKEHPRFLRELYNVGIEAVNLPKRSVGPREWKNSVDIYLVMDMVECLLEKDNIGTYLLMAGDRDFIRITTLARNRFNKKVIISAVPPISLDLSAVATDCDPFVPPPLDDELRMDELIRKTELLEKIRPFVSRKYLSDTAAADPKFEFMSAQESWAFVSQAIASGMFESYLYAGKYKALKLNRSEPRVARVLHLPQEEGA